MLKETTQAATHRDSNHSEGFREGSNWENRYRYEQSDLDPDQLPCDCLVVAVRQSQKFSSSASALDSATDQLLSKLLASDAFGANLGETLYVPLPGNLPAKAALLVGTGPESCVSPLDFKSLVGAIHQELLARRVVSAGVFLEQLSIEAFDEAWKLRQLIVFIEDAAYQYGESAATQDQRLLHRFIFNGCAADTQTLQIGCAIAAAMTTTRKLGDMPPNICTPSFLADYARSLATAYPSLNTEVLDELALCAEGMGAMLSVGRGSAQASRLIVMRYTNAPEAAKLAPIVLVGKGVTFDTGGTALKTRQNMRLMKYDMCGAGAVLGVMKALALSSLPINVIGICACAENMPGSSASRPSDTVRSLSGRTIEILNPDAEGRLLLCDALSYAERFAPSLVIDLATLTGASVVALGHHYSALFSNNDAVAKELIRAGEQSMDKVWQLPLSKEDLHQLDSKFADIANMGDGSAACVVAALFLSVFASAYPWVHLDISGTAKIGGDAIAATGRPVALLMELMVQRAKAVP